MTKWIWIIGIAAIAWPMLLEHLGSSWLFRKVQGALLRVARAVDAKTNHCEERISQLSGIVEKQDQLIAALWAKTYGYPAGGGGFVGENYVASSVEPMNEAWGVRPAWRVHLEALDEYDSLARDVDYPWGKPDSLYRGEVSTP